MKSISSSSYLIASLVLTINMIVTVVLAAPVTSKSGDGVTMITLHSLHTTDVTDECIQVDWGINGLMDGALQIEALQLTYSKTSKASAIIDEVRSALLPVKLKSSYQQCGLDASSHYDVCVWFVHKTRAVMNRTLPRGNNCVIASTMESENTGIYIGTSIGAVVFIILFMVFLCLIRIRCSLIIPKMIGRKRSASVKRRVSGNSHSGERKSGGSGDEEEVCGEGERETSFCERRRDGGECSHENCALCRQEENIGSSSEDDEEEQEGKNMLCPPSTGHSNLRQCNSAPAFNSLTSI